MNYFENLLKDILEYSNKAIDVHESDIEESIDLISQQVDLIETVLDRKEYLK